VMRPQDDPARRCLPVDEWPNAHRLAWRASVAPDDPLSLERSSACNWRSPTSHKNRRGYGRWLTFLKNSGAGWSASPAECVTRERVAAYLAELRRQRVAPFTARNRILELLAVMLVIAPDRDWGWLKACGVHLDRQAEEALDRSLPPLLASDVINRGIKELRRRLRPPASVREAIEYRDWLMVTVLTLIPLRLRNFAAMGIARHLTRRAGIWRIDIDGTETKTGRALLPHELRMFFDYYMSHVRPRLNRGRGGDSLWLNRSGSSLSEHRVYLIIVELTQRAFGVSVNPHLFRRIFATSVSIVDPQVIEGARAALGHATSLTTQQHYNRATSLTAARNHMEIVRRLRRRTNPLWKERERRSELKILKDGPLTICRKPTCA
jgi:integrase/recombinase XerD